MGMTLVNGYLTFKNITDKELILREFNQSVALTMCAKQGGECGGGDARRAAGSHRCAGGWR